MKVATDALELLDPSLREKKKPASKGEDEEEQIELPEDKPEDEDEADEEIVSEGALKAEKVITSAAAKRKEDVERIKSKALLRRARARSEIGNWSSLSGAEEDYKQLSQMTNLSAADKKFVQRQLVLIPPRTKAAQESEMAEMMSKLKGLGNSILRPFGLSTDNFKMQKDEKTGGYSMNFNQG